VILVECVEVPDGCVLLMPWVPAWGRQLFLELQKRVGQEAPEPDASDDVAAVRPRPRHERD
jgi:hypothetical protein